MRGNTIIFAKEALVAACPCEKKPHLPVAGGEFSEVDGWTTLWKEPPGHPTRVTFYQDYPARVTLLPTLTHRLRIKRLMNEMRNVPQTILIRGKSAAGALSDRENIVSVLFYNALCDMLHSGEIELYLLPAEIEDSQLKGTSLERDHLDPNGLYNVILEQVKEEGAV